MATSSGSKKLTKSSTDKMLTGVLGGVAERLGWDSTLVRVLYVVLTLVTGLVPMLLVYLILFLVMD
ncbi:MAG: PspC domain-containing protein [Candidatus Thermoplasmatota archaeon]|nr:PspC domain-containing protein [Candidatus Thermoplasmatota archaeon]